MYKWGLLLLCFFFCVNSNNALKCFSCIASTTSDCYDGKQESYLDQDCDRATNKTNKEYVENVCVQYTYLEPNLGQKIVQRGCGFIWKEVDICDYLRGMAKIEDCYFCKKNYCNGEKMPLNR